MDHLGHMSRFHLHFFVGEAAKPAPHRLAKAPEVRIGRTPFLIGLAAGSAPNDSYEIYELEDSSTK